MKKEYQHLWMVEDNKKENGTNKSFWTRIGVAFRNRDGSWSIELQAIPVSGRLQMRPPKNMEDAHGV